MDYAERLMRQAIARLLDGSYSATSYIDGFLDDPNPQRRNLPIKATVTIAGDEITVDLTGTPTRPRAQGAYSRVSRPIPTNFTYPLMGETAAMWWWSTLPLRRVSECDMYRQGGAATNNREAFTRCAQ
jgi:hypothetical protein